MHSYTQEEVSFTSKFYNPLRGRRMRQVTPGNQLN